VLVVLLAGAFLGSALSQWWSAPAPPVVESAVPGPPAGRVRVEVLNGGGRGGMARSATDLLRDGGYDVVFYGNASSFEEDSSVVLDRVGDVELARAVADVLGIRRVVSRPDRNLYLDVTVVLGEDWSPTAPPPETTPAWWDVRRFLKRGEPLRGSVADPGPGEG